MLADPACIADATSVRACTREFAIAELHDDDWGEGGGGAAAAPAAAFVDAGEMAVVPSNTPAARRSGARRTRIEGRRYSVYIITLNFKNDSTPSTAVTPSESFPMPASPIARRPAMLPRSAPLLRWTMRHLPTALCSAEEVPASAMVLETRTFTSCRLRCSPHQTSRASTRSSSGSISYSLQQIRSSSNVITQQGKARHCCMLETPSSAATGCALITRRSGRPCVTLSSGRC